MQTKRRSTYERIVWQEGVEVGLEQGLLQGHDAGRLAGQFEGRYSAARDLLLDLIRVRFSGCPPSIQSRIEAIQDEAKLRELALAVVTTASAAEFESLVVGGDH